MSIRRASHRPIAALCLASLLAQAGAPALAWADAGARGDNPFARVPKPVMPQPVPHEDAAVPARDADLASWIDKEPGGICKPEPAPLFKPAPTRLACAMPYSFERSFQQLLREYVRAYTPGDAGPTRDLVAKLVVSVFGNAGSADYEEKLQSIDQLAELAHAVAAASDLAMVLQKHWETAFGMKVLERLGRDEPAPERLPSLGEIRNERRQSGRRAGGVVGGVVALTALGLLSLRNPSAAPRYFAVFRSVVPMAGVSTGIQAGALTADRLSSYYERGLPQAPAHVMKRLGFEYDAHVADEDRLFEVVAPALAGIAAADAVFAITQGQGAIRALSGVVRAAGAANKAATVAKINPAVLVGSIVTGIVVERLVGYGIDRWEYGDLKSDVRNARKALQAAIAARDEAAIFKASQDFQLRVLALATFAKRPLIQAFGKYEEALAEAQNSKDPAEIREAEEEFVHDIQAAQRQIDQKIDADYEAMLALDALDELDPSSVQRLSPQAREHLLAYGDLYDTFIEGSGDAATEEQEAARFKKFVTRMRASKDRELAAELARDRFVRHSGHTLLQGSSFLKSTRIPYIQRHADFLAAQILLEQKILSEAAELP
jgi:hypothetical protein